MPGEPGKTLPQHDGCVRKVGPGSLGGNLLEAIPYILYIIYIMMRVVKCFRHLGQASGPLGAQDVALDANARITIVL